jgi:hypothetical protein
MPEITFDSTDNPTAVEQQQTAEAKALEQGDKLIAEEEAIAARQYEKAREDAESELRYAGKFKSAEDLEKAYKELEKKLGQKTNEDDSDEVQLRDDQEGDQEGSEEGDGQEVEADETVDFLQQANDEYWDNGEQLKPETIQKLKELPSDQLIEAYLKWSKGQQIQPAQPLDDAAAAEIVKTVGGQEQYNQTLEWAAENLTPEEVAAYDNVINSGNKDAIFFAVQALNQKFRDAVGFEGKTVSGKAPKNNIKGFRSQAELARAISDPRYRNDPAYRLDVEAKLAASGDLL